MELLSIDLNFEVQLVKLNNENQINMNLLTCKYT